VNDVVITVVRHAAPRRAGVCYGRAPVEVVLDPEAAALEILRHLEPAAGPPITALWTSPASRCAEPAAVLARHCRLPLRADERLWELDFGAWEGTLWTELERSQPEAFHAWANQWQTRAPPGGETVAGLTERVRSWSDELEPGHHLAVAHAGVIRALAVLRHGLTWEAVMARPVPHLVPRPIFQKA
jgi:alpha-ribazole phosphatase